MVERRNFTMFALWIIWKRYARTKGEPLKRMCRLKQLREITFKIRSRCLQLHVLHQKIVARGWLIDSGCIDYMTSYENILSNGKLLKFKGKGEVVINSPSGTKIISDVLLVHMIDQNLLSIGQLLEKKYNIVFKNYGCIIFDSLGPSIECVRQVWLKEQLALRGIEAFARYVNLGNKQGYHSLRTRLGELMKGYNWFIQMCAAP
ncbi:gag-pol polyprotein [Gossypium australe]|uniref:Gag-pol polyprotein n=1 Tax=Gossypium australe TaxID=47621 RepID=A0A5B6VK12_9ROSI|nr:gag-pol polyprotein [Gossypium australe]